METQMVILARYEWITSEDIAKSRIHGGLLRTIEEVITKRFRPEKQNFMFSELVSIHEDYKDDVYKFDII